MMSPRRAATIGLLIGSAAILLAGCQSARKTQNADGPSGGGGILAEISGLDPAIRALPGITYSLFCQSSATPPVARDAIVGQSQGSGASETLRFPGDKITDSDSCSMEVRIPPTSADFAKYEWTAKGDPAKAKGLLYGSERAAVGASRTMTLKVIKTHRELSKSFLATIKIQFELGSDGALPKAPSAAMSCKNTKQYSTNDLKITGNDADVTFKIPVADFGPAGGCTSIIVLDGTTPAFEGVLDETIVKFANQKENDPVSIATVFKVKPKNSVVNVNVVSADPCLDFNATLAKCMDLSTYKFAQPKNYWIAHVEGMDQHNTKFDVYVTAKGAGLLTLDSRDKLDVKDLSAAFAAGATDDQKSSYLWLSNALGPKLPFLAVVDAHTKTTDGALKDLILKESDLAAFAGAKVLNIESVWINGFGLVSEAEVGKHAMWFAAIDVTSGATTSSIIVGGKNPYFEGDYLPTINGQKNFFDSAKSDLAGAMTYFKYYSVAGGLLSTPGCKADKQYYIDALNTRTWEGLKATGTLADGSVIANQDAAIEACAVTKAFDTSGWTSGSIQYYNFGMHKSKIQ